MARDADLDHGEFDVVINGRAVSAKELLLVLLDNMEDFVFFKDRDRRFIAVSRSFEALLDREQREILGKRDEELFPPEIATPSVRDDERILQTGEPIRGRIEGGVVAGGRQIWVLTSKLPWYDHDGQPRGVYGISRNITQLKTMQAALEQNERQLRSIGDTVPLPIATARASDRIIVYANKAFCEFIGVSAGELCGRPSPNLCVDPNERTRLHQHLHEHGSVEGFCVWARRGDGALRWVQINVHTFVSDDEPMLVAVVVDITEQREREQQLEQLSRERDTLLQEVNHRVSNNLAALLALVEREATQASTTTESLDKLGRSIRALASVHGMLSEVGWDPVQLSTLCRRLLEASCAGINQRLSYRVSESPLTVTSRVAHQLAIVLGELVTNTLKHTPHDCQRHVDIEITLAGSLVSLRFADDGPGYAPAALTGQSPGFGLTLIRRLVAHSLRGSLTLSNEAGAVATMAFDAETTSAHA